MLNLILKLEQLARKQRFLNILVGILREELTQEEIENIKRRLAETIDRIRNEK